MSKTAKPTTQRPSGKDKPHSSWKDAFNDLRRKEVTPPPGFQSVEEIAHELGRHDDKIRHDINQLVKTGRAEVFRGKKLTAVGNTVPMNFFRLLPAGE